MMLSLEVNETLIVKTLAKVKPTNFDSLNNIPFFQVL